VLQCVAVILEAAGKEEGPVVDAFSLCLAVCCDVLQCVAVILEAADQEVVVDINVHGKALLHCNTLQHTATRCNALPRTRTATHCHALQHSATPCNTLQHLAIHCSTLQRTCTAT